MEKRIVTSKAAVEFKGREYVSSDLIPYIGESVQVMEEVFPADVVVFDMDGHFLTLAKNEELWAEMTAQ